MSDLLWHYDLLGSERKRLSLWLFFSFPIPGDIDSGYQVIEVTGMMVGIYVTFIY